MCKCKCDTPEEGVLLEEEMVVIPLSLYEQLIRAETERDVLEATIENDKYEVETVLSAIKTARKFHATARCTAIKIDVNTALPEPEPEPAEDVNEDA